MADRLELDVRQDGNGRSYLFFPFMSLSDVHLLTRYSRAKRLCQLLENTEAGSLYLLGDIIDGVCMRQKARWNVGPWHRQAIAHIARKADSESRVCFLSGNHEEGLRGTEVRDEGGRRGLRRNLSGKSLYGISVRERATYRDPQGRNILLIHGDQFDDEVFGKNKSFWYGLGDTLYTQLYEADSVLQDLGLDHVSLAASGKRAVKVIINKFMNVNKEISGFLDKRGELHGILYGHSHMGGFATTPGGKVMMNDGCCTEHVQAMVHDRHGRWALIEWHKDRMHVLEESGESYAVLWSDLGLGSFRRSPVAVESAFTDRADRILRAAYRMWPPRDRQALLQNIRQDRTKIKDFNTRMTTGDIPTHPETILYAQTVHRLAGEEHLLRAIPVRHPGHTPLVTAAPVRCHDKTGPVACQAKPLPVPA